jgi:hypothetical protein
MPFIIAAQERMNSNSRRFQFFFVMLANLVKKVASKPELKSRASVAVADLIPADNGTGLVL